VAPAPDLAAGATACSLGESLPSLSLSSLLKSTVTSITAHGLFLCYGYLGRNGSMDKYKLHRERVPVATNRLGRLIEVVAGAIAALILVYLLR
jgi:hypothetical protein